MKRVLITLALACRDDVPAHVLGWMRDNLVDHAVGEFDCDYDPAFVRPRYDGPPLVGSVVGDVYAAYVPDDKEAS
jgi:hypothetical protein